MKDRAKVAPPRDADQPRTAALESPALEPPDWGEMSDNEKAPANQQEPSMEDILASIRRILSEDGDGKQAAAADEAAAQADRTLAAYTGAEG